MNTSEPRAVTWVITEEVLVVVGGEFFRESSASRGGARDTGLSIIGRVMAVTGSAVISMKATVFGQGFQ